RDARGALERLAFRRADGADVLPTFDAEGADDAAVDLAHPGRRRVAAATDDRCWLAQVGQALGTSTSVALCPPNPNQFESTGLLPISRAVPITTSRPMSSPMCSRLAVGGAIPSRIDSSDATASAAPAPAIMWPSVPLLDVTGGGSSPNTLR